MRVREREKEKVLNLSFLMTPIINKGQPKKRNPMTKEKKEKKK
jgi:hypothetical protein